VKFSEGFHPKPKVSFSNPLPTGIESEDERMVITASSDTVPQALIKKMNAQLPEGLTIYRCSEDIPASPIRCTYRIVFGKGLPGELEAALDNIDYDRDLVLSSPKGKLKKIPLRDILINIKVANPISIDMTLSCEMGKTARPTEVLKQGLGISEEALGRVGIRKLRMPDQN
jgi:radical SAM-linked protein